jgi:zinc protease
MKTLIFIILSLYVNPLKAADTLDAYKIIQKYISAIGGKEKLSKVEDRITEMEGNVQNVNIKMTVYQKQPDKFKQVITAGEVVQTIYFNNGKGNLKINNQVKEISGLELAKLKNESTLNFLLNLDTNNVHLTLLGIDTLEAKPVYKVLLKSSTLNWIHYYDTKTGYKIMDEKPITAQQKTFLQKTFYSNFREVDGLLFPFKIKQNLGNQEMEFDVLNIKLNTGLDDFEFNIEK